MDQTPTASFDIPYAVLDVTDLALLRVRAIYPGVDFRVDNDRVVFEISDQEQIAEIRRELAHAFYRQKIHQDTKRIRETLVSG